MDTNGQFAVECQRQQAIDRLAKAAKDVITVLMTDNDCKCLNELHAALADYERIKV